VKSRRGALPLGAGAAKRINPGAALGLAISSRERRSTSHRADASEVGHDHLDPESERREDPGGEVGRTASVHELEQGVDVDLALPRQSIGKLL
jgi:hypothetical protein